MSVGPQNEEMQQTLRQAKPGDVAWQHKQLERKLRGHYDYYGISGNIAALSRFRFEVSRVWRKWLDRRSNRALMTWSRFQHLQKRYPLPSPALRRLATRAANP